VSRFRNPWLLATASSAVLTGAAQPQGALAAPPAPPSWTGFYTGVNLGAAQHYAKTTDVNGYTFLPPSTNYVSPWFDSRDTSFTFGGQAGYNWQLNMIVVGVEADFNWVGAKKTFVPPNNFATPATCAPDCTASATNELEWLATVRGRGGVAIQQFLVYGTAGLAVGRVSNRWGWGSPSGNSFSDSQFALSETRTGVVYGGGVEFSPWQHWVVRVEGLHVDLGTSSNTTTTPNQNIGGTGTFRSDFENTADIVRGALSYRW
jgi:outer membrane immunogenic protein